VERLEGLRESFVQGLLGYQPFFLDNGIVLGTGLQLFSRPSSKSKEFYVNPKEVPGGKLGNIWIPENLRNVIMPAQSDFYSTISDDLYDDFVASNFKLCNLYKYMVDKAFELLRLRGVEVSSFVELGANTGLFGSLAQNYVQDSLSIDIVDYSATQKVLELFSPGFKSSTFIKLKSQRSIDIDKLPTADFGWSYAVAQHQSNPMIHIADLSSISNKCCFVMTTTLPSPNNSDESQHLLLEFQSSNSYYSAPFPQNFDVTLMSKALLIYSLQQTGFDEIIEIEFPSFVPYEFKQNHSCYLAIRKNFGAPSIYSFARYPERDGNRHQDSDSLALSFVAKKHNVVSFQNLYWIVPHGISADSQTIKLHTFFYTLHDALEWLDVNEK
jgi:hypothetical protein